jgi:hypothetical protein
LGKTFSRIPAMKHLGRILFCFLCVFTLRANPPEWWLRHQVLAPGVEASDYAVVNQGQLKNIAAKAVEAMNERLPGGAGTTLNDMVAAWKSAPQPGVVRQDYAAVNIGQLKAVALPFYQRLESAGFAQPGSYAWAQSNADSYAAANIGQVKHLFDFYLPSGADSDGDYIPDTWEVFLGSNPQRSDAYEDPLGTGYVYYERYWSILYGLGDPGNPDAFGNGGNGGGVGGNPVPASARPFYAIVDLGPVATTASGWGVRQEHIKALSEKNVWVVTSQNRRWHDGEWMQLPPLPDAARAVTPASSGESSIADIGNDGTVLVCPPQSFFHHPYMETRTHWDAGYYWQPDGTVAVFGNFDWPAKILQDASGNPQSKWIYRHERGPHNFAFVSGMEGIAQMVNGNCYSIEPDLNPAWINRRGDVLWRYPFKPSEVSYSGSYPVFKYSWTDYQGVEWKEYELYSPGESYPHTELDCINYDRVSVGNSGYTTFPSYAPVFTYKGGLAFLPEGSIIGLCNPARRYLINAPREPEQRGYYTIASDRGYIWWRKTDPETGKLLVNMDKLVVQNGMLRENGSNAHPKVFEIPEHVSKLVDINNGWGEDWEIQAINDSGILGAQGKKKISSWGDTTLEDHLALLVPCELVRINSNSFDQNTGTWTFEEPENWLTYEAFPAPEVEIIKTETEFVQEGIKLTIRGKVRDKIAKFLKDENEKIKQIKIFINNELQTTHELGNGDFDQGVEFTATLVHPIGASAILSIRVETEENIATLKGWAKAAVNIVTVLEGDKQSFNFSQMGILPQGHTSDGKQQIHIHIGEQSSPIYSGNLVEETQGSHSFAGTLNGVSCQYPIKIRTGIFGASFPVQIEYTTPDGATHELIGTWGKPSSQNDSVPYASQGVLVGGAEKKVLFNGNLNAYEAEEFVPVTFRLKAINGWENNANIRLKTGDAEYPLKLFAINGKTHLYPYDERWPGEPKLFLPSKFPVGEKLKANGYDPESREFKLILRVGENENVVATFSVEAGTDKADPFAPNPATSATGGEQVASIVPSSTATSVSSNSDSTADFIPWEKPGDRVSREEMLLTYRFIYGMDPENFMAIEVLDLYLEKGHEISMGDVWGDYSVDLFDSVLGLMPTGWSDVIKIKIEEDDDGINPVVCAQLLHTALEKAMGHPNFMNALADKFKRRSSFPMLLQRMQQSAIKNVGAAAISVGELYIAGIEIISVPAGVIVSMGEVAGGNYAAVAGVVPLVGRVTKTGAKKVFLNIKGVVVQLPLGERMAKALEEANKMRRFSERFAHLEKNGFNRETIELLVLGGGVKYAQSRSILRRNMKKLEGAPNNKLIHAHHDLPVQFEKEFASKGIDINNADYGRWVHIDTHQIWHSKGSEKFNNVWKEFLFDSNGKSLRRTKEEILDFLDTTIRMDKFPSPLSPPSP